MRYISLMLVAACAGPGPSTDTDTDTDTAPADSTDSQAPTGPGTNQAPFVDGLEIVPARPDTTSPLQAVIAGASADPDGDEVQMQWRWRVDGVLVSDLLTDQVPADRTLRGQVWTVEGTPTDGRLQGAPAETSVTIANAPPAPPVIDIQPGVPFTSDDLVGVVTTDSTDPDGDVVALSWQWTTSLVVRPLPVDGMVLPSAQTRPLEVWTLTVTATDGVDDAPPAVADVQIANRLPSAPTVTLAPQRPDTTHELRTVIAAPSVDLDGSPLIYRFAWDRGGVRQPGVDAANLPAALTSRGETWTVHVWANDGYEDGPATSDSVVVGNATPTPWSLAATPAAPQAGDAITCSVQAPSSDPDADPLSYTLTWEREGTPTTFTATGDATVSVQVPAGESIADEQWRCVGRVSDLFGVVDAEITVRTAP